MVQNALFSALPSEAIVDRGTLPVTACPPWTGLRSPLGRSAFTSIAGYDHSCGWEGLPPEDVVLEV